VVDRRTFLGTLAGGLLAAPLAALAQRAGKVYRVGVLGVVPAPALEGVFRQALRERGYIANENFALELRWSEGKPERFSSLAEELVRLQVDVIVTVSNLAAQAAKNATKTIPIVMATSAHPDQLGLIENLAKPGGNITGLTLDTGPQIAGKMLQLLKEASPRISRVGVIFTASSSWAQESGTWAGEIGMAARTLGLTVSPIVVRDVEELKITLANATQGLPEGVIVDTSALAFSQRRLIVDFATRHRIPGVYAFRAFVEDGGLMAYGVDLKDIFRRAAVYVDKIIKGAKPGDLPVEQPTKFELVINLKTARALGLTIPPSLLLRADQVIE
jgi:putative ABC transport system substrate-binding protein